MIDKMIFQISPHWTLTANPECQPSSYYHPNNTMVFQIQSPTNLFPQEEMFTSFQIDPNLRYKVL